MTLPVCQFVKFVNCLIFAAWQKLRFHFGKLLGEALYRFFIK